jgi:hypothetical protein
VEVLPQFICFVLDITTSYPDIGYLKRIMDYLLQDYFFGGVSLCHVSKQALTVYEHAQSPNVSDWLSFSMVSLYGYTLLPRRYQLILSQ